MGVRDILAGAVVGLALLSYGCGKDLDTAEWGGQNSPDRAMIDTGAGWEHKPATPAPAQPDCPPSPAPVPVPVPSVSPSPVPSVTPLPGAPVSNAPRKHWWCTILPWLPGCGEPRGTSSVELAALTPGCDPAPVVPSRPVYHSTKFCKVNEEGKVISGDTIQVFQEGDVVHGVSGGCIARPIREVWAVFLNGGVMKPDDVDEYHGRSRPDLVPTSPGSRFEFIFDFENTVHALGGLVNPTWTVRWWHGIPHGTYERPNQVAINFQKVDGTTHIRLLRGGYVLDRTSDTVTSYAMEQFADADRYDQEKANRDMARNFERLRTGTPDWASLPEAAPVPLPEGSL